jgi:hypothetical protein
VPHPVPQNLIARPKKKGSWNPFRIVTGFLSATGGFDSGTHFYTSQTSQENEEYYGDVEREKSLIFWFVLDFIGDSVDWLDIFVLVDNSVD